MAWVRLDDQIARSRKHIRAGGEASWFWVCAIAYCSSSLTDGFVAEELLPFVSAVKNARALAEKLVEAGLFDRAEGGYRVHDYLKHNDSKEMVMARRQTDADRKRVEYHNKVNGIRSDSIESPTGESQENVRSPETLQSLSSVSPALRTVPLRASPVQTTPHPPERARADQGSEREIRTELDEQTLSVMDFAVAFWDRWRDLMPSTPLQPTLRERMALEELARTPGATVERFSAVAKLLVESPSLQGKRGIGMLRAKWGELCAWLDAYPDLPFDDPAAKRRTPAGGDDLAAKMLAEIQRAEAAQ